MKFALHGMKASSGEDMWLDGDGEVVKEKSKAITFDDADSAESFLLDCGSLYSEMFSVREIK